MATLDTRPGSTAIGRMSGGGGGGGGGKKPQRDQPGRAHYDTDDSYADWDSAVPSDEGTSRNPVSHSIIFIFWLTRSRDNGVTRSCLEPS
jgi:hypothetical protein